MKTILLIEDDRDLNAGLTYDLELEKYKVFSAFTLAEGREILACEAPDLITSQSRLRCRFSTAEYRQRFAKQERGRNAACTMTDFCG